MTAVICLAEQVPVTVSGLFGRRHFAVERPHLYLPAQIGTSEELPNSSRLTFGKSGEFGNGRQSRAAQLNFVTRF